MTKSFRKANRTALAEKTATTEKSKIMLFAALVGHTKERSKLFSVFRSFFSFFYLARLALQVNLSKLRQQQFYYSCTS